MTVPAYYALIFRSLTVLEGLALYADPNFKVLAASYPYFAKRLLTDPNPYLRDALIELLFKDGKFRFEICFYLKSGTNMNWNWTSRNSGKSFGHPALRRFLSLLSFF